MKLNKIIYLVLALTVLTFFGCPTNTPDDDDDVPATTAKVKFYNSNSSSSVRLNIALSSNTGVNIVNGVNDVSLPTSANISGWFTVDPGTYRIRFNPADTGWQIDGVDRELVAGKTYYVEYEEGGTRAFYEHN